MTRGRTLEQPNERTRGYARERRTEDTHEFQRARPRMGGTSPLPASAAAAELFLVSLEDLAIEERAGAGWCVRLGVPDAIPGTGEYDVHELVVEITVTTGGSSHVLEVNAYPGCTVHLVGEQVAARVKWGVAPVVVPPAASLRWQVSRGICPTTAVRAYTVQAATTGLIPSFATGFALFSGDDVVSEDLQMDFATHASATRIIQHYGRADLLQCLGDFAKLPPGAGQWRWLTATAMPVRLVFSFGDA